MSGQVPNFEALYFERAVYMDDLQRCDTYAPCGDCCRCLPERAACGECLACRVAGSMGVSQEVGA